MSDFLEDKGNYLLLRVRVQPKASANRLQQDAHWGLRAYLTAPPQDGAANRALIALVAKQVGVSRSQVSLVQGDKSRSKTLRVEGIGKEALERALA